MTSEYNFGVNPLYADIGSPYQNMAKNEYTNLDNYSYFRSPNRSILSTYFQNGTTPSIPASLPSKFANIVPPEIKEGLLMFNPSNHIQKNSAVIHLK
jgi:hypothetical protein